MSQQTAQLVSDPMPVTHATFRIERTYPHPPAHVFFAHSDAATKRRWHVESDGFEVFEHQLDFRVGGSEIQRFRYGEGPEVRCDVQFQDIIPDQRLIFSYRMSFGTQPFSASLATIELTPVASGTRLTYTEQGAYFGDPGGPEGREEGMRQLLEALAAELDRSA